MLIGSWVTSLQRLLQCDLDVKKPAMQNSGMSNKNLSWTVVKMAKTDFI